MTKQELYFFLILLLELRNCWCVRKRGLQDKDECRTDEYFDTDRLVCLDRCGAFEENLCTVDEKCSSHTQNTFDPSICIPQCSRQCPEGTYCDTDRHQCLPCSILCSDRNACRIHCYAFIKHMTTEALHEGVGEAITQHFDEPTKVSPQKQILKVSIAIATSSFIVCSMFIAGTLYQLRKLKKNVKSIQSNTHSTVESKYEQSLLDHSKEEAQEHNTHNETINVEVY